MDNTKIDWCDATWNPVTGCQHECPYCYAQKIAQRYGGHDHDKDKRPIGMGLAFGLQRLDDPLYIMRRNGLQKAPYPWFFLPTFHCYKLDEPAKWKKPRVIFVCSMADLFGEWVPDSWIEEVFQACERAPQHTYLFLTKNPRRYDALIDSGILPERDNMWYGSTCTTLYDQLHWNEKAHTFMSCEPMLASWWGEEASESPRFMLPEWVILGAETGRRSGKVVPERWWLEQVVSKCRTDGIPLFMKSSLAPIWGEDLIQEWPKGYQKYGRKKNQ